MALFLLIVGVKEVRASEQTMQNGGEIGHQEAIPEEKKQTKLTREQKRKLEFQMFGTPENNTQNKSSEGGDKEVESPQKEIQENKPQKKKLTRKNKQSFEAAMFETPKNNTQNKSSEVGDKEVESPQKEIQENKPQKKKLTRKNKPQNKSSEVGDKEVESPQEAIPEKKKQTKLTRAQKRKLEAQMFYWSWNGRYGWNLEYPQKEIQENNTQNKSSEGGDKEIGSPQKEIQENNTQNKSSEGGDKEIGSPQKKIQAKRDELHRTFE